MWLCGGDATRFGEHVLHGGVVDVCLAETRIIILVVGALGLVAAHHVSLSRGLLELPRWSALRMLKLLILVLLHILLLSHHSLL